ncbi:MAG: hypothetical protein U1E89_18150 [Burkholderiaceae bacterium]
MVFATVDGFPTLTDLVDFKWLMAAEGHAVHLERLQSDGAYARECLSRAAGARSQTLRWSAARLDRALALAGY